MYIFGSLIDIGKETSACLFGITLNIKGRFQEAENGDTEGREDSRGVPSQQKRRWVSPKRKSAANGEAKIKRGC